VSDRKPIVIAPDPTVPGDTSAQLQQLQGSDDLDIPLQDRVAFLESVTESLLRTVLRIGAPLEPVALQYLQDRG
jgi:hypothetical protein